MSNKNFKFSKNEVERLIRLKHSDQFRGNFNSAEGNPKTLKKVWEDIGKEISSSCSGKDAKVKYNSLYAIYKNHLDDSKKSGAARPTWRYWEVFQNTATSKEKNYSMPNVIELHSGEIIREEMLPLPTDKVKRVKRGPTNAELKQAYLEKSILLLDTKLLPLQENMASNLKSEIKDEVKEIVRKEVKEEVKDLKSKLDLILDFLTKNRKD